MLIYPARRGKSALLRLQPHTVPINGAEYLRVLYTSGVSTLVLASIFLLGSELTTDARALAQVLELIGQQSLSSTLIQTE